MKTWISKFDLKKKKIIISQSALFANLCRKKPNNIWKTEFYHVFFSLYKILICDENQWTQLKVFRDFSKFRFFDKAIFSRFLDETRAFIYRVHFQFLILFKFRGIFWLQISFLAWENAWSVQLPKQTQIVVD